MIPPLAGRDAPWPCRPLPSCISIHPPLAGRDRRSSAFFRPIADFNPPVPCGAGLQHDETNPSDVAFQSTRPLRGGTRFDAEKQQAEEFQSTRPLRGGTCAGKESIRRIWNFNPPAPCGAGRDSEALEKSHDRISIHPPLAGRDKSQFCIDSPSGISIHPPLAGRDSDLAQKNCVKHRILHKKCIYPGRIERFSGFDAAIFLPNVHKFRCEPSEESLLAPRSHAYTIRTPSC